MAMRSGDDHSESLSRAHDAPVVSEDLRASVRQTIARSRALVQLVREERECRVLTRRDEAIEREHPQLPIRARRDDLNQAAAARELWWPQSVN